MKKNPRKLTLSRETLAALTLDQARAVQGGGPQIALEAADLTGDSKNVCCC
jgi:hypothetical protein